MQFIIIMRRWSKQQFKFWSQYRGSVEIWLKVGHQPNYMTENPDINHCLYSFLQFQTILPIFMSEWQKRPGSTSISVRENETAGPWSGNLGLSATVRIVWRRSRWWHEFLIMSFNQWWKQDIRYLNSKLYIGCLVIAYNYQLCRSVFTVQADLPGGLFAIQRRR